MGNNLSLLQEDKEKNHEEIVPLGTAQNDNSVFIGEALSEDEKLNLLMTDTKPYITILVGFEGYGKTSFVATCYNLLLRDGKIGNYRFCDSDTLVGLERRSFLRRYNETLEGISPTTKRTIRGEAHLLTFHFTKDKNEKITIFSDHSGEDYRNYANKQDEIEKDILIQNADKILFFIDIPSLLDKGYLSMYTNYRNLLTNMKSAQIFRERTQTILLFNKIDTLEDDKKQRFEGKKQKIVELFSDNVGTKNFKIIELTSNNIEHSDNLQQLLREIVESNSSQQWMTNADSDLEWVKQFIKEQ